MIRRDAGWRPEKAKDRYYENRWCRRHGYKVKDTKSFPLWTLVRRRRRRRRCSDQTDGGRNMNAEGQEKIFFIVLLFAS
jgi:hypothetical protein